MVFELKDLLKLFDLTDDAINIYLKALNGNPQIFNEIKKSVPDLSENEVIDLLKDLVEKKLILPVNPKDFDQLNQYISIPPYAAMLNIINKLNYPINEKRIENSNQSPILNGFMDLLYKDLENISGELIEVLGKENDFNQTMEILSEVEENVREFVRVILNDVLGLISPLRLQSAVDARDFSKLIESITQKITESEGITTNMFSQFKDIIKERGSPETSTKIEAIKTFIRKLGESIEIKIQELNLGTSSFSLEKIKSFENSLYELLANIISLNTSKFDKFWQINSPEMVLKINSALLDKCTNHLTLIVPNIEDFIPLEELELNYSQDIDIEQKSKNNLSKTPKSLKPNISKKQKKEIEEKLDLTSKKVAELKGFELSHDVADVIALISEVNPGSIVIESIQGWLNRLLVIRKHLDSNTQYLLLENIDKWKNQYLKVKIDEKSEIIEEMQSNFEKEQHQGNHSSNGLTITIISSESHTDKNAIALSNRANIEYLQMSDNNIFACIGDDKYLAFGVNQNTNNKKEFESIGFYTAHEPLIKIIKPVINKIKENGKYPNELEINRGFNNIIENINDYSGKKIAKILKYLLDVAFEKEGISLDILELKLLISKLEKRYHPLDDELKEYVIKELNQLNKKFSSLDLIYPPEFRPSVLEEGTKDSSELEIPPPEIKELDKEKVDNLFELLLDKIDDLKGIEICEQIDKFIDIILELQGYSEIIEWKKSLNNVDEVLEEPFREKIKEDILKWKLGILQQNSFSKTEQKDVNIESHADSIQKTVSSIIEEEYISPGLSQSQFAPEEEDIISDEEPMEINLETQLKDLFDSIQNGLEDKSGIQLSKLMQNTVDVILETQGYSMSLKELKDWISKLKKINNFLENEVKEEFELEISKWKEKFC
ncbi:MAG: hypothetical protein ACFE9Z_07010 [Promethearchaeota archaeon]